MKTNYVGVVEKIRMLSMYPKMLVRFSLVTQDDAINCIVFKRELANTLLMLPEQSELAVYGHLNKRNQLVVDKMMIRKPLISA